MIEQLQFQHGSVNDYLLDTLTEHDSINKTSHLLQTQELYNSAWGWHGVNLDD